MSINFVIIGPNRIVACSDDRTTHRGTAPFTSDGGLPKIFKAGRYTICGCAGIVRAGPGPSIKQRLLWFASQPDLADSPQELLEVLRDDIRQPLIDNFSDQWVRPEATLHLSAFALRRLPSGEVDLLELQVPLRDRKLLEPQIVTHMQGVPSFPLSRDGRARPLAYCRPLNPIVALAPQIDTDSEDANILASVDRVFKQATEQMADFREAVGGRIDVAAVDSDGFRLLRGGEERSLAARTTECDREKIDWGPLASSPLRVVGDLSIGMWVKLSSNSQGTLIYAGAPDFLTGPEKCWPYWMVVTGLSNNWSIACGHDSFVGGVGGNVSNVSSPFPAAIRNNTWTYLGLSRDTVGKTYKLYLGYGDGVSLVGTFSYSNNPPSAAGTDSSMRVGISIADYSAVLSHFQGAAQEHYIWSRALTEDEHVAAMAGNPSLTGMVLGCRMGDDPEVDLSGNGASGTVTGTTLIQGHN